MAVATMHSKRPHRRSRRQSRQPVRRPKRGNQTQAQWREAKARWRRKQRAGRKNRQPTWQNRHPSNARASYKHLLAFLVATGVPLIASQLGTLAAFVVGAFLGESAHLPTIAYMPLQIKQRSRLRRLERWIASQKIKPVTIMAPYAKWYLSQIKDPTLYIVLDFTTNTDQFLIAMVSVIQGKRTVPIYRTIDFGNTKGDSRKK